jgi:hypothetical protein
MCLRHHIFPLRLDKTAAQFLGRSRCNSSGGGLVDRIAGNLNLVVPRGTEATVQGIALMTARCFLDHEMGEEVATVEKAHFVQVLDGTAVNFLLGEIPRSCASLKVNEYREPLCARKF